MSVILVYFINVVLTIDCFPYVEVLRSLKQEIPDLRVVTTFEVVLAYIPEDREISDLLHLP
jgi:hypothetical protein